MSYESLLDRLKQAIPDKTSSGERFVIPLVESFYQGNKTVLKNFDFICQKLRRKPEELMKYLFKELATPGVASGKELILQAKVNSRLINEKITDYVNAMVLCRECGKPDTHFDVREGRRVLVCEACGAKRPVGY